MRSLVTGGAGFLGLSLCRKLLDRGDEVICLDNLSTSDGSALTAFAGHSRFQFMRHDVTVPFSVSVDRIFNLACPASPVHYQADPIATFKTSVIGMINVLELAETLGVPVLQTSTSEVYGDPAVHPQAEQYWGHVNPIGIRACYDEGKRGAETLCFDYHRQRGVRIKVARLFNTYGPGMGQDDGRAVANFVVQALSGSPLTVYGSGEQTRSFCYVDDTIDALIALMNSGDDVTGPVNIGNPHEMTLLELAENIIDLTKSRSKIEFRPLPDDDPRIRQPDITRARALLGWEPKIALRDGLARTVAYFDKGLNDQGLRAG